MTLTGTLFELRQQAGAIAEVTEYRNAIGWTIFQSDERWLYVTHPELGTVCPKCSLYGGHVFNGDQIPVKFEHKTYDPFTPFMARPRTHQPDLSQFFDEECHCDLIWQDALDCLERRLHREKEEAI